MDSFKQWFLASLLPLLSSLAIAQDVDLSTFNTENEGLYFDQVLIYNYADHTGKSGEIWIYLNSCNHRLLFDHSSWGREDEMIHYIIAQQDGAYITFGTEAEGPRADKVALIDSIYLDPIDASLVFPISDEYVKFKKLYSSEQNSYGLDIVSYAIEKTKDTKGAETISMAKVDFDTQLIYNFNGINVDLQIPHVLGNQHPYLHPNHLITKYESSYKSADGKLYWSKLELVAFENTNYWAPIADYIFRIINNDAKLAEILLEEVLINTGPCE